MVRVFLLILNQMDFHLVQNRKEYCHHDHIPLNLKGNGILDFSVQAKIKPKLCCFYFFVVFARKSTDFAPDASVTLAELHFESRSIKPNLDCSYTFPIGFAPSRITVSANCMLKLL